MESEPLLKHLVDLVEAGKPFHVAYAEVLKRMDLAKRMVRPRRREGPLMMKYGGRRP
jgi:hypothetical protein